MALERRSPSFFILVGACLLFTGSACGPGTDDDDASTSDDDTTVPPDDDTMPPDDDTTVPPDDDTMPPDDDTAVPPDDDTAPPDDDTAPPDDDTAAPADSDGDGYLSDTDCNDGDPSIHPGAADGCGDGVDNDCDGVADPGCCASATILVEKQKPSLYTAPNANQFGPGRMIGDVDGDGQDDVILPHVAGGEYMLEIVRGPLDPAATDVTGSSYATLSPAFDEGGGAILRAADLDADGDADLLLKDYYGGLRLVSGPLGPGGHDVWADPVIETPDPVADDTNLEKPGPLAADLTGDGVLDVVYANHEAAPGGMMDAGEVLVRPGPLVAPASMTESNTVHLAGVAPGEVLGASLAVGDFDGDGHPDLAAGAVQLGVPGPGRVYVWFGPLVPGTSPEPSLLIGGEMDGDQAGFSLASPGDLDGGGYDALLVGAPTSARNGPGAGAAYLHRGPLGPGAASLADADGIWVGAAPGDGAGQTLAAPGDLDGDGFPDLAIGAPEFGARFLSGRPGSVVVVSGATASGVAVVTEAGVVLQGESNDGSTGWRLDGGGDLDGDGHADLVVARGRGTHVVLGPLGCPDADRDGFETPADCADTDPLAFPGASERCDGHDDDCNGLVDEATAADAVPWHPDTDADGYGDPGTTVTACNAAYGWTTDGTDCDDGAPTVHPHATDTCGDGIDGDCDGVAPCGLAGTHGLEAFGARFDAELPGDHPGPVEVVGDANGDGYSDLVIGDPYRSDTWHQAGMVALVYGPVGPGEDVLSRASVVLWVDGYLSHLGYAVDGAGDLDGDGFDDFVVSAPGNPNFYGEQGVVYVVRGPVADGVWSIDDVAWARFDDPNGTTLGISVAGVGDVTGDGVPDVAASAPLADSGGEDAGRIYVFPGPITEGAHDVTSPDLWIDGQAGEFLGKESHTVASAGDVNGDGNGDLAVMSTQSGVAYLFFGPLAPGGHSTATADQQYVCDADAAVLAGLGDLDGDGHDDLALGAYAYDGGRGRVWVFHGSPGAGLRSLADVSLTLTSADYRGLGVGISAGDFDGDGSRDLALAAGPPYVTADGRVLIFYGPLPAGTVDMSLADATLEGGGDKKLGYALTLDGDLDADGKDDLVVVGEATSTDPSQVRIAFGREKE